MHKTHLILPVFAAFLILSSACQSPKEDPIQRYANAYCECAAGIAQLDREAAAMAADTSATGQDKLTGLLNQLQTEYAKAAQCLNPLVVQQGRLGKEDMAKLRPILQQKCPDAAANSELIRELIGQ